MSSLSIVYGLLILLLLPLAFHLIAFKRSTKFLHVIFSFLVGEYVLIIFMMLFSYLHLFSAKWILIVSLLTVFIIGRYIGKKENIKFDSINICRRDVGITLFFAFFILVIQKDIQYNVDALATYFPWARIIIQEGTIPPFHLTNNIHYVISYPPLLHSNIALLFSSQGSYSLPITRSIPILYSSLTVFLLLNWAREYNNKYLPLFAVISLFGIWPSFMVYSGYVLQETPLLFFTTVSFYLLFKYLETKNDIFLVLLAMSSSLGMLTKYSSLVILFLILCALVIRSNNRGEIYKISSVFIIFAVPVLLWSLRNLYFYGNPFFPMLSSIFGGKYGEFYVSNYGHLSPLYGHLSPLPEYLKFGISLFVSFPAFVFSFIHMYRNRREFEIKFVFFSFMFFHFVILICGLYTFNIFRYTLLFIGIFALYSGAELSRLNDLIPIKLLKEKKEVVFVFLLVLLFVYSFVRIHSYHGSIDMYEGERHVLEYLTENEIAEEELRVFGGYCKFLIWHGNITSVGPFHPLFLVMNDGVPFKYDENSEYYYNLLDKLDIDYVYGPSRDNDPLEPFFEKIESDDEHFELVFDKEGQRLWRVKKSGSLQ